MSSREQSPGIMIRSELDSPASSASHNDGDTTNHSAVAAAYKSRAASAAANASAGAREGSTHADPVSTPTAGAGIVASKSDSRVSSQANSVNASQPRATSTTATGNGAARPTPAVPALRLSGGSQTRPSTTSASGEAAASQPRASGAAATAARVSTASANGTAAAAAGRPPSVPVARTAAAAVPQTPSASMPRPTVMSAGGGRRAGGSAGSKAFMPTVTSAAPNYAAYPSDVSKYLKDVIRRREEAMMFRLLPTAQLLEQTVLQAQVAHDLILQQAALEFAQIVHKRKEAELKRKELETTKANKAKVEEQKRQHKEAAAQQKLDVAAAVKQTESELRERLAAVVALQPKLGIVQAIMAQAQDPASDCALLAELLVEEKQLQKALKGDARYNKSKTADVDGGAEPHWWKQCICASFNIAAAVKGVPHRASIVDVSLPTKVAADKKVVVVRDAGDTIVAWAQTRCGPDANALVEAYLAAKPEIAEMPPSAYKGIVWTKEEAADVTRKAKAAKSPTAEILAEVITSLSYMDVASQEMSRAEVLAAGEAAA
ncbi:hypothetical protein NESM_000419500 [Novymonas esmeraldas]|uniref:Uncharacterized protein n=1 Tax=Novymonas esmeraldas TaxID=1808958 RepID=A0AAW0EMJ7_9TRYP